MAKVKFEILRELDLSMDETPHIFTFKGCVMEDMETDDGDYEDIDIGECDGFVYEIGRSMDEDEDIHTQADSESGEIHRYLTGAVDGNLTVRANICKLVDIEKGIIPDRLLVINCVEIYPGHRGKNLGLEVVTSMINTFGGGCDLVMIKAWPMQRVKSPQYRTEYCDRMQLPEDDEGVEEKLLKHWAKAGFRRVDSTNLMVRTVDSL